MTKTAAYGLVLATILFTVVGQLLIKWQAAAAGPLPASWPARLQFVGGLMLNPWIVAGLCSAVIAALAWILAMTRLPISIAYPIMSATYPLVICASWLLFRENISQWQILGTALILAGVALVGLK